MKGRERNLPGRKELLKWRHEGCSPSRVRACMHACACFISASLDSVASSRVSICFCVWLGCAARFVYLSIRPVCATCIHTCIHLHLPIHRESAYLPPSPLHAARSTLHLCISAVGTCPRCTANLFPSLPDPVPTWSNLPR